MTIRKGAVKLHTEGFAGDACVAATSRLQERIGVTVSDEPTDEMDTPVTAAATEVQHEPS